MSSKRGASHQITKDDYEDDAGANSDDDSASKELRLKQGFKRAPDEVILKRKIYKVKRTFAAAPKTAETIVATNNDAGAALTTLPSTNKNPTTALENGSGLSSTTPIAIAIVAATTSGTSSNPFASTVLAASSSTSTEKPTDAGGAPSTKKVFGFGSASASSIGKLSSGFGGGFASVGTAGKSSGFGAASSSSATGSTTSGFAFGSSSSSSPASGAIGGGGGGTSKSLFGSVGTSGITFSLSKKPDNGNDSTAAVKEVVDTTKTTALPDKVDLKTGEEGEEEIHSGRCKSFVWVLGTDGDSADDNDHGETSSNKSKTNLSVQSSTQFQAAISSSKSSNDDNDQTDTTKGDKSSNSDDATHQENNGAGTAVSAASKLSEEASMQFRWMELGIGPVKILRSKSNPERLRLVQRRESSKMGPATKVILNVPLWRESTCERDRQALQYLRLKTMKEGKMCQYSLKFKENVDAGYFHHHLMDHIPLARKCFDETCAGKTS